MSDFIRLDRLIREGNRVTYDFTTSLPYFKKKRFFVEYDARLGDVPAGFLAVPFAAAAAPVAWAAGARLTVGELDRDFMASLESCKDYFRSRFAGRWSFDSSLEASPVANECAPTGAGMLFSSGLDSLTTYIRRKAENPELFTVFGADIPLAHADFIKLCKTRFETLAREHGARLRYIHTDIREALDFDRLRRYSRNWYGDVAHGLMMSALVAPASYGRLRTLYVASCAHRARMGHSCGSDADLLERVRWAGAAVKNDNQDLTRSEKIALYLKDNETFYPSLRVCWMQFKSLNCSRCEKCLRTICELLANNIDPARCNFSITAETLPALRRQMESRYYLFFHSETTLDFWRALQEGVDLDGLKDLYGSKRFFEWFSSFRPLRQKQNVVLRAASSAFLEAKDAVFAQASLVRRALPLSVMPSRFADLKSPKGVRL